MFKNVGIPYAEDLWREVEIENAEAKEKEGEGRSQVMTIVDTCPRCLVRPLSLNTSGFPFPSSRTSSYELQLPNVDPTTGERDAAVPHKLMFKYGNTNQANKAIFGTYGVPEGDGIVRMGDRLKVRQWVEEEIPKEEE